MISLRKSVVTLYIDDASIRMLVTSGKGVKQCAELLLEPGLVRSNVVLDETAVANKIRQLLKIEDMKIRKVVVGLSGLHGLTRPIVFPHLPKAMIEEAVLREAKRLLPVPLEQLYLSWQVLPSPPGKTHVFVAGIPVRTFDTLYRTLKLAGLRPSLMGLKPILLAEVPKEPNAIIIDVQPSEFDIVIMSGRVPQPVRTMAFPNEELTMEQKLQIIQDDLERTVKFFNSSNPDKPLNASVPIMVSGQLANELEAFQNISSALGFSVMALPVPALRYRQPVDTTRYMSNLALAAKELAPGKRPGVSLASLDVLPAAYKPKPISWLRVAALPAAVVSLLLIGLMTALVQDASAKVDDLRGQVTKSEAAVKQRTTAKQQLAEKLSKLQKELAQAQASREAFERAIVALKNTSNTANTQLALTVSSLNADVTVTQITYSNSIFTVQGSSKDEAALLRYGVALESSEKFTDVLVASAKRGAEASLDFKITLKTGTER